jgi:hypothetical protein
MVIAADGSNTLGALVISANLPRLPRTVLIARLRPDAKYRKDEVETIKDRIQRLARTHGVEIGED